MGAAEGMLRQMNTVTPVFFDVDGTLVRWQLFADYVEAMARYGLFPRIVTAMAEDGLRAYKEREGRFRVFVERQVEAYQSGGRMRGIRVSDAEWVAKKLIEKKGKRVHVFTRELALAAADVGMRRALISGSPVEVVRAFAEAFGISIYLGSEHPHFNGVFTGGEAKEWVKDKCAAVSHLVRVHDFDLTGAVAIGDSTSDVDMFECALYPVCFNPTRDLLAVARARCWPVVIERKDVRAIFVPDEHGRLAEATCSDILPVMLAEALDKRLASAVP